MVDSLEAAGDYVGARLACERVVCQTTDPALRNQALLRKGRLFKAAGNYTEAQHTLLRANAFVGPDSLRFWLKYELALTAYLSGDYPVARTHAQQVRYLMAATPYRYGTLHLELMTLHAEQRWDEARALYEELGAAAGYTMEAETLYGTPPKLKNANTAEWLHILLPGTGLIYAETPGAGLLTGLVYGGGLAFGTWQVLQGAYFSGIIASGALLYGVFSAGYRYTTQRVQANNDAAIREYNTRLNAALLGMVR